MVLNKTTKQTILKSNYETGLPAESKRKKQHDLDRCGASVGEKIAER